MVAITQKEKQALLIIFKDFSSYYNANSISKILNISHVGAQKILKGFFDEDLVVKKQIGKSIVYKLNLSNNYVKQLLTFLLADDCSTAQNCLPRRASVFHGDESLLPPRRSGAETQERRCPPNYFPTKTAGRFSTRNRRAGSACRNR